MASETANSVRHNDNYGSANGICMAYFALPRSYFDCFALSTNGVLCETRCAYMFYVRHTVRSVFYVRHAVRTVFIFHSYYPFVLSSEARTCRRTRRSLACRRKPALRPTRSPFAGACSGPNCSWQFVEPEEVIRIILILTLRAKH